MANRQPEQGANAMSIVTDVSRPQADHREVVVALPGELGVEEQRALERVGRRFPPEEFRFAKLGPRQIVLELRALDLDELRASLDGENLDGPAAARLVEAIEAIRSYGIQGRKRLYVGCNAERKVKNRRSKEATTGKHYYTRGAPFSTQNDTLPEEKTNRIFCGDAETVLAGLPDNCVDLVFTSPPYNFGLDYESSEDGTDWEGYFEKLFRVFDECIRVLKFGGRIVVNIQPLFSSYIPSHHFISNFFTGRRLIWKGEILWEKNNYNCKYTAWGSWKSPSNPYLKYTWEFLEIFCKGDMKKTGNSEDADITADEFKQWVVAKWSIAPERDMEKYGHPAMFPEELAYRVIRLFRFRNDVVLDPFNGVGTTTAVARRLGRRFVGIDVSEEYCSTAERRLCETSY